VIAGDRHGQQCCGLGDVGLGVTAERRKQPGNPRWRWMIAHDVVQDTLQRPRHRQRRQHRDDRSAVRPKQLNKKKRDSQSLGHRLPDAVDARWSDDRLIAVREDGSPIRHEWYSDQFQRLRQRAGLRRIHLKGLRNTSVSLMLAGGMPVHVVAAWHGHDPAVSLSIYSEAQRDDLRAAGAALFS
jgi:integrase